MQNKKLVFGSSLAVAVVLAGTFSLASAYRGDFSQKGPNFTEERHEAMTEAFESRDYGAWKELRNDQGKMGQVVTEENFEKFSQMRELMREGNIEEANEIKAELGLGQGKMKRGGGDCERRGEFKGKNFQPSVN